MHSQINRTSGSQVAKISICLIILVLGGNSYSQINPFVQIIDPLNPILAGSNFTAVSGGVWVDYDADGLLDIFIADGLGPSTMYHNEGSGVFTEVTNLPMVTDTTSRRGVAWVDFDNDGDVDCMLGSNTQSDLFRNDGGGVFVKLPISHLGRTDTRGWSPAFADYDNDGNLDMVMTFASGSIKTDQRSNFFVRSNGYPSHMFTSIDTGEVVTGVKPYTCANWCDIDNDGDMDLFIGTGPIATQGVDDIYFNQLKETGQPGLARYSESPMATDLGDGQVWNFIDYDNDGDLDAFSVNFGIAYNGLLGEPNVLYRNDNDSFVVASSAGVSLGLSTSLSASWGDFDNDGDIDCVVANQQLTDRYLDNNGDGTFAVLSFGLAGSTSVTTSAGDFDNDGDLDMFEMGGPNLNRKLYRNDIDILVPSNGWVKFSLEGTKSNRSALGALIRIKANINGGDVWQMRSISAQNTFLGHNSLDVHFGLGDASLIDSLVIDWPSGQKTIKESLPINQMHHIVESGLRIHADKFLGAPGQAVKFSYLSGSEPSQWSWDFGDSFPLSQDSTPTHLFNSPGLHDISLTVVTSEGSDTATILKYIGIHSDTLEPLMANGSSGGQNANVLLRLNNILPVSIIDIPITWTGPFSLDLVSIDVSGLRSSAMSAEINSVDTLNGNALCRLSASMGDFLAPGNGPIATLSFVLGAEGGPADSVATVTIEPVNGSSPSVMSEYGDYEIVGLSGTIIRRCCQIPGDADNSGSFNIADVTFGIDRIFNSGPAPACQDEADADGDNAYNIADITFGIARIFGGGPAPVCGTTGS